MGKGPEGVEWEGLVNAGQGHGAHSQGLGDATYIHQPPGMALTVGASPAALRMKCPTKPKGLLPLTNKHKQKAPLSAVGVQALDSSSLICKRLLRNSPYLRFSRQAVWQVPVTVTSHSFFVFEVSSVQFS